MTDMTLKVALEIVEDNNLFDILMAEDHITAEEREALECIAHHAAL